ncbi:MAG TPA: creatininase family protein [Victivallales bacterium]|nr:creatininase family protein [Victivallales bacterium]
MKLQKSTWQEVEEYLKKNRGIIIPIGSTEQHGPSGLIGTDAICSEIIADRIQKKYNVMIGPTLELGIAHHHLEFTGTITLRPSTLIDVLIDVITSLNHHGFTHIYFINGHGGNIATINTAFAEYYHQFSIQKKIDKSIVKCCLNNWWLTKSALEISKKYFHGAEGCHATPSEISVASYAYPDLIKKVELNPKIAPAYSNIFDAVDYRNRYSDGRIGSDSSLATKEIGEEIVMSVRDDIWTDYSAFLKS